MESTFICSARTLSSVLIESAYSHVETAKSTEELTKGMGFSRDWKNNATVSVPGRGRLKRPVVKMTFTSLCLIKLFLLLPYFTRVYCSYYSIDGVDRSDYD